MKKYLFILLIFSLTSWTISAQEVSEEPVAEEQMDYSLYPEAGDFGITANVTGLIGNISAAPRMDLLGSSSLLLRYTHSRKITYRLGIAPNVMRFNQVSTDSVGKDLVEFDSSATRSNVSIRPGVEFHLKGGKRLDPYIAVDAELGLVGRLNIGSVTNVTDTTGTSRMVRTITEDGGFALGGKLSAGMNYYISKKFFVGMEYGIGINGIISGGDRQEVIQIEPVSGTNTTIRDLSSIRTTNLNFFVDPMVQLTIGYFFGF